jgi:4-coumarate--CoA ligase
VRYRQLTFGDFAANTAVDSPFPSIREGPYPPLYEFITENYKPHGGHLDDHVAIIDGTTGMQRTFRDYYTTATGLAGALRYDLDVNENDTVAMFCPNHVDYAPTVLAVALCGAKITPINPLYTAQELHTVLDRSHSKVLIVHRSRLDIGLSAAKDAPHVKHLIVITDTEKEATPEGTIGLDWLRSHHASFDSTVPSVHGNSTAHPVCLPYSSGTTGLPKGVCLTHSNLIANLLQMEVVEGSTFPSDHKVISPLPFFHIYAFTVSMLYPAWKGQTVITSSGRFQLPEFCKLVQEHRPQRSHLVPPILLGLAQHPVVDEYDLSSLQTITSAAAPLSVETEQTVSKRLGGCKVKQAWGMSELSPIGTINSDTEIQSGSVGPLAPSTIGKIINANGDSLPANQPGELVLKGPQVMMGYLGDLVKTRECLSEAGWLRTGDVAHYDENGFFYITDRIKELIKVRGYPVAPAELEALLLTHPAVSDAAVIQVADAAAGELPRAYVVLKQPGAATESDIYEWTKEKVAAYKRLDGGVVFVETIPKSASGKILRRILRDQAKEEQSSSIGSKS